MLGKVKGWLREESEPASMAFQSSNYCHENNFNLKYYVMKNKNYGMVNSKHPLGCTVCSAFVSMAGF